MGYSTDFSGDFALDRPLAPEHKAYLDAFAETRRMRRDPDKASKFADPLREAVGLPIGQEGGYYVGSHSDGCYGQNRDDSILDYNEAPGHKKLSSGDFERSWQERQRAIDSGECQPGLWCKWQPNEAGTAIEWNGAEKFYDYVPWLKYLIDHFLGPWGYKLNGTVEWQGEEGSDFGAIVVDDNVVRVAKGRREYGEPELV